MEVFPSLTAGLFELAEICLYRILVPARYFVFANGLGGAGASGLNNLGEITPGFALYLRFLEIPTGDDGALPRLVLGANPFRAGLPAAVRLAGTITGSRASGAGPETVGWSLRVLQQRAYGYRDEDYLKLKIIAVFLPPLPRNANINPHVSA